jgi:hypothetical protein
MKNFRRAGVAALLLWGLAAQAQFVDPSLRWRTLDTEHFSVHFAEHYGAQGRLVAEVAETVYPRITEWLRWKPEARTQIVVVDSLDPANGLASPLPFNLMGIVLATPDQGELLQNREWLELVLTHEFTHVVHMDKASGTPLFMRRIFGRAPPYFLLFFPNTLPNVWGPGWVKEGLAVYAESDRNKGWGRLGQSRFEGMMRAEVGRGLVPLREIHADGRGFPHNRDYLYGSYFFLFLGERYGPQAIADYVENYSGNFFPYRMHSNTVAVTGKPQDELWLEYEEWLRARFAAGTPLTGKRPDPGGEILARAFSLTSPLLAPKGERWYVRGDGYTRPKLMRQAKGGEAEAVRGIEPLTRLSVFPRGELLLSKIEICGNYNYYYDLYRLDAEGTLGRVTECGRFRFAAPLDDGRIVAVRVVSGEAEVVILNKEGAVERSLYRAAPGEALAGLAARGETAVVTSLRDGRWSVVELADGKASVLLADRAVKHSPRFGDSGDEIYFVADYGNVENVWSWRRAERRLARWTGALNGVREISAPVAGEMLITTIEADGDALRLHRLPDAPLETREAAAAAESAPSSAPAPGRPLPDRDYAPWSSLLPRSWFPAIYAADGAVALGVQTFGQDALGLHQYALAPMYEFTQRQTLGSAAYVYDSRHGLLLNRLMTVKASSANDEKFAGREIKAYAINETAQWVSLWRDLSLGARYYWGLGGALDREIVRDLALGTSAARDERVAGLVAGADTRRQQLLSEGPSQGQQLRVFAETSNRLRGAFSGNFYRADWRAHLPARKAVVSLRWNEAHAQAQAEPIQLGGSFSEEAFALPVLNQREFPLRGYRSGESVLTGHHARLATVEWRTPLTDVDRHLMVPPVGLNRLSMSLFFDTGAAWESGAPQRYFQSGGLELLSELRLGYLFGVQLRLGVAKGFQAPGAKVAYLHLGRSF